MTKITLKIEGMMCGMCEAHMNDAAREVLGVSKISSSHLKKETVITADEDISDEQLRAAVEKAGYELVEISRETIEKKGFFAKLFGK